MSDSCDCMDCSLSGSSVHGILQIRILEQVAISFSWESSWPKNQTQVSRIVRRFFTDWAMREARDPSNSEQLFPSLMSQGSLEWTKYNLGISPLGSENTMLKAGPKNYLDQELIQRKNLIWRSYSCKEWSHMTILPYLQIYIFLHGALSIWGKC